MKFLSPAVLRTAEKNYKKPLHALGLSLKSHLKSIKILRSLQRKVESGKLRSNRGRRARSGSESENFWKVEAATGFSHRLCTSVPPFHEVEQPKKLPNGDPKKNDVLPRLKEVLERLPQT